MKEVICVPLAQNMSFPTINDVFGDNPRLVRILQKARVRSVATVMLLPREVLRDDARNFSGIGARTATYITGALAEFGLGHHTIFEPVSTFVNREFGSIERAPIAVLHVATLSDYTTSRQVYAPIRLLHHLEAAHDEMEVGDLARYTDNDIRALLERSNQHGPILELLETNIRDLDMRLSWWKARTHTAGDTSRRHLYAVNQ